MRHRRRCCGSRIAIAEQPIPRSHLVTEGRTPLCSCGCRMRVRPAWYRPPSSSGLGHRPLTAAARVQIPLGVPRRSADCGGHRRCDVIDEIPSHGRVPGDHIDRERSCRHRSSQPRHVALDDSPHHPTVRTTSVRPPPMAHDDVLTSRRDVHRSRRRRCRSARPSHRR